MPSPTDKFRTMVDLLYLKTADGKIAWQVDAESEDPFTKISNNQVSVKKTQNNDFDPLVTITITNSDGLILEHFSDEDISLRDSNPLGFPSYWKLLEALHEMAIRNATGADVELDKMLEELGEK